MSSLKQEALAYEAKRTLNIVDLDRVDLSFPVEERNGENKDGEKYTYKVMIANGIEYRTPYTVLEEIQKMLALKPDLAFVKVTKTGEGKATKYKVALSE